MAVNQHSRALELMVNAAVGAQELVRMELRSAQANLPFTETVNNFYLYNWGDYMNGFQIAFFTNWAGHKIAGKVADYTKRRWGQEGTLYKIAINIRDNNNIINVISGASGSAAVVFAETTGLFTIPDPKDIPAGILGALTYMAVRYLVTKGHNLRMEDVSSLPTTASH